MKYVVISSFYNPFFVITASGRKMLQSKSLDFWVLLENSKSHAFFVLSWFGHISLTCKAKMKKLKDIEQPESIKYGIILPQTWQKFSIGVKHF